MLGGTASCSWVTFELSWKTVKGRACVSVKRRIQAHRNPESSLRFCSVPFQFHTVEEGAACLLQLSGASSESWIKLQVFWKLCLQWAPWFDLVLNYFLPQITFEEVNTYWERVAVLLLTLKLVAMTSAFLKGWDAHNAFHHHMQSPVKSSY